MLEEFQAEEKTTAPVEARYLVNTWDGVEWYVCWRSSHDTPWILTAVEETGQKAINRMQRHIEAQKEKPMYFGKEGHLLSG